MGHVEVGWVMHVWGGSCRLGVEWGRVGHVGVWWVM